MLLQEHHLGQERTKLFKDPLPGDWHTWWAGCAREERRSPYFGEKITKYCHFGSWHTNRRKGMFYYLEWRSMKFVVLNIYAPNSSSEKTSFWRNLANKIPSYDNSIVVGDFNMTERINGCLGTHSNLLQGEEVRAWGFLIAMLGIRDSWYPSMVVEENSLRFSQFGWKESEGCHSRLDRIYAPKLRIGAIAHPF